ncbi:MAG: amino acid ABC transporter ATP-binding protein [Erysipelotrichaceae bacterium]|nr:amino acid ABC transporter ATP-binding protein [Erysipelotrichaceae bacterium]
MISIRNLTKGYNNGPILENVSLEINKGEALVIIGGSGCGKSTLLRCMNRLIVPEKGEIYVDGENILDPNIDIDKVRRKMGMVYQHFNLFSHLNILENIILAPMKVNGVSREEAEAEAKELLHRVGLDGREYHMPSQLSGGQKQRVAIARTLAMHPELILFDEPTSALDPTMVDEVEKVIRDLINDGMTSVIVTHEMNFARKIADRVIFLADKRIYEEGTAEEVFDHPSKPLTQQFLYRSRMFEKELNKKELDLYSLASEMKKFLLNYQSNDSQQKLISVLCDELLYPLFEHISNATIRMLCSDGSDRHMIHIYSKDFESDPLTEPYIDELNMRILEHYAQFIFSKQTKHGWNISIQMLSK